MTARYVRLPVFARETGYTEKAVRAKIQKGVWVEGREYRRASVSLKCNSNSRSKSARCSLSSGSWCND
jgi:hypothetical protein